VTLIRPGDELVTGRHALVVIQFSDGSKVEIGPSSSFVLESESGRTVSLKDAIGKILLGGINRKFPVRTPTAICGVRGTIYTVESTSNSTRVRVYDHTVAFTNTHGKVKRTVMVHAGYESTITGSSPPTQPRRFTPPAHPFWR
jgi:hypothetical protein